MARKTLLDVGIINVLLQDKDHKYEIELMKDMPVGKGGTCLVYHAQILNGEQVPRRIILKEFYPVNDIIDREFYKRKKEGVLSAIYLDYSEVEKLNLKIKKERFIKSYDYFNILHNNAQINNSIIAAETIMECNGTFYIIEAYDSAKPFSDYLKVNFYDFLVYLKQFAETIQKLHEAGYYHFDISPTNFLILSNGTVKVMDTDSFLMKHDLKGDSIVSRLSYSEYSAPELERYGRNRDSLAYRYIVRMPQCLDIYSVGMIVYRYIFGEILSAEREDYRWQGYKNIPKKRLKEKLKEKVQRDIDEYPLFAIHLVDVLLEKTLAVVPYDRFQSMGELLLVIEKLKEWFDPALEKESDKGKFFKMDQIIRGVLSMYAPNKNKATISQKTINSCKMSRYTLFALLDQYYGKGLVDDIYDMLQNVENENTDVAAVINRHMQEAKEGVWEWLSVYELVKADDKRIGRRDETVFVVGRSVPESFYETGQTDENDLCSFAMEMIRAQQCRIILQKLMAIYEDEFDDFAVLKQKEINITISEFFLSVVFSKKLRRDEDRSKLIEYAKELADHRNMDSSFILGLIETDDNGKRFFDDKRMEQRIRNVIQSYYHNGYLYGNTYYYVGKKVVQWSEQNNDQRSWLLSLIQEYDCFDAAVWEKYLCMNDQSSYEAVRHYVRKRIMEPYILSTSKKCIMSEDEKRMAGRRAVNFIAMAGSGKNSLRTLYLCKNSDYNEMVLKLIVRLVTEWDNIEDDLQSGLLNGINACKRIYDKECREIEKLLENNNILFGIVFQTIDQFLMNYNESVCSEKGVWEDKKSKWRKYAKDDKFKLFRSEINRLRFDVRISNNDKKSKAESYIAELGQYKERFGQEKIAELLFMISDLSNQTVIEKLTGQDKGITEIMSCLLSKENGSFEKKWQRIYITSIIRTLLEVENYLKLEKDMRKKILDYVRLKPEFLIEYESLVDRIVKHDAWDQTIDASERFHLLNGMERCSTGDEGSVIEQFFRYLLHELEDAANNKEEEKALNRKYANRTDVLQRSVLKYFRNRPDKTAKLCVYIIKNYIKHLRYKIYYRDTNSSIISDEELFQRRKDVLKYAFSNPSISEYVSKTVEQMKEDNVNLVMNIINVGYERRKRFNDEFIAMKEATSNNWFGCDSVKCDNTYDQQEILFKEISYTKMEEDRRNVDLDPAIWANIRKWVEKNGINAFEPQLPFAVFKDDESRYTCIFGNEEMSAIECLVEYGIKLREDIMIKAFVIDCKKLEKPVDVEKSTKSVVGMDEIFKSDYKKIRRILKEGGIGDRKMRERLYQFMCFYDKIVKKYFMIENEEKVRKGYLDISKIRGWGNIEGFFMEQLEEIEKIIGKLELDRS